MFLRVIEFQKEQCSYELSNFRRNIVPTSYRISGGTMFLRVIKFQEEQCSYEVSNFSRPKKSRIQITHTVGPSLRALVASSPWVPRASWQRRV